MIPCTSKSQELLSYIIVKVGTFITLLTDSSAWFRWTWLSDSDSTLWKNNSWNLPCLTCGHRVYQIWPNVTKENVWKEMQGHTIINVNITRQHIGWKAPVQTSEDFMSIGSQMNFLCSKKYIVCCLEWVLFN